MATYSTGISATWGGVAFVDVFDLAVPLYGSVRKDRTTNADSQGWSDAVGTVSISAYGSANMNVSEYGKRKALVINGGGAGLTTNAVCIGITITPQLNGVTRYTFTAQLLDT